MLLAKLQSVDHFVWLSLIYHDNYWMDYHAIEAPLIHMTLAKPLTPQAGSSTHIVHLADVSHSYFGKM